MRPRPRHAFVVRDREPIPPLGEPAARAWLLDGRLGDKMARLLEREGLVVERVEDRAAAEKRAVEVGGAVVVHDSVAFSRALLRGLLKAWTASSADAIRAVLPAGNATDRLGAIGGLEKLAEGWAAPLYVLSKGSCESAVAAVLPFKEQIVQMPIPVGMMGQRETPLGMTDTWMCRVDHWAHILRINQIGLISSWMERWQSLLGKLWFIWRALILGFPWRGGRGLSAIRRVHGKAFVHHTAHVELSVVEAGAYIGPNAVVKSSWVGKNAKVDDGAIVNATVLADGAIVASASSVMGAVLYPEAFAAQHKMQLCVFGEASVAFTGSYFYDLNFTGNVRVSHRGKVVDAGDRMLSVCLGPRARVAGGVWIASGREVPAGALIVQPPDNVLYKLDEQLTTTRMVTIRDKAAVDVGELPVLQIPDKS